MGLLRSSPRIRSHFPVPMMRDKAACSNAALRADGKRLAGASLTERAMHQGTGEHERGEANEAQEESGEHVVLPCVYSACDKQRDTGSSLLGVV